MKGGTCVWVCVFPLSGVKRVCTAAVSGSVGDVPIGEDSSVRRSWWPGARPAETRSDLFLTYLSCLQLQTHTSEQQPQLEP